MEDFYLTGQQLQLPALRFNPSSPQAQHQNARQGLKIYGPYDAQRLAKDAVRCTLVYPAQLSAEKAALVSGLMNGVGAFRGFQSLFRIPLVFVAERKIQNETETTIEFAMSTALREDKPDLIVVLTRARNQPVYTKVKSFLLGNGVPSQVVTVEKLRDPKEVPWILENIALQIYAKIGGTPWTVMSSSQQNELIFGVSWAIDKQKNCVVGFVTLFTHDGDFQFLYSLAPRPIEWENLNEYRDALARLIVDAYREYEQRQGRPSALVIHLCKRPGKFREIAAVEQALQTIGGHIPYALLHLNDDTNYRLFDTSNATYVPRSGIKVEINPYTALLFLDGRLPDRTGEETRRKRGVPRVLEISMDRRSSLSMSEFPRLVEQVFAFARVNWRGFNAQTIPATLNYSYLVARLVTEVGADNWNAIVSAGALRDKAWFL
jgi:argonaute-like protein implicated in RNA metabolism and viral defense